MIKRREHKHRTAVCDCNFVNYVVVFKLVAPCHSDDVGGQGLHNVNKKPDQALVEVQYLYVMSYRKNEVFN